MQTPGRSSFESCVCVRRVDTAWLPQVPGSTDDVLRPTLIFLLREWWWLHGHVVNHSSAEWPIVAHVRILLICVSKPKGEKDVDSD